MNFFADLYYLSSFPFIRGFLRNSRKASSTKSFIGLPSSTARCLISFIKESGRRIPNIFRSDEPLSGECLGVGTDAGAYLITTYVVKSHSLITICRMDVERDHESSVRMKVRPNLFAARR